jgi:pimeloyl-ACP methyl ester carboxylesterase
MSTSPQTAGTSYYGNSALVRLARLALAVSQQLWPGLAVGAAQRLFGTPLPPRWLRRPRDWPAHWLIERWPFERADLTLYRDCTVGGEAPAVLLVHGWGGHAGQMLPLASALAARGLQALILEMPAHGRSAGSTSNLPQFARAVEYVAARLQASGLTLHAVVAHSLGANAAAHALSRGLAVQNLVMLAPPASPHAYTQLFARMFGLSEPTRRAMQQRIEAREGILMPQFEPQAVGPRITQHVLVVHDRGDRINRFADGEAYGRAIAGATLHATEGLGHMKILKDPAVLARVVDFASNATLRPR